MPSTRARKTAAVSTPSPEVDAPSPALDTPTPTAPARKTARRPAAKGAEAANDAVTAPAVKSTAKPVAARKATTRKKKVEAPATDEVAVPPLVEAVAPVTDAAAEATVAAPAPSPAPKARKAAPAAARKRAAPRKRAEPVADEAAAPAPVMPGLAADDTNVPVLTEEPPVEPARDEPMAETEVVAEAVAPPAVPARRWSEITLATDAFGQRLVWQGADECPEALAQHAASMEGDDGLDPLRDDAWLQLQALAEAHGHELRIDPTAWRAVARGRDVRWRVHHLEQAYPEGTASAALRGLWADGAARLAPFHLEGALFAACAGRCLLADEAGLDPLPQALLAMHLFARHFGVQRVLVLCPQAAAPRWQRARLQAGLDDGVQVRLAAAVPADGWSPELVIVDDLHRWPDAPPCAEVRTLTAPYALVLMHEPAERPQVLADWLAWLDTDRLGPARQLRRRHQGDAGWHTLDKLRETLDAVMLRRTRGRWLQPVPGRRDRLVWVPQEAAQQVPLAEGLHRLDPVLERWRRVGYVSDLDQLVVHEVLAGWRAADAAASPAKLQALQGLWQQAAAAGHALLVLVDCAAAAGRLAEALQQQGLPARAGEGEDAAVVRLGDAAAPLRRICATLPWPAAKPCHEAGQGGAPLVYLLTEGGLDEHRLLLRCRDPEADAVLADPARFCQGPALVRRMATLAALRDQCHEALLRHAW